MTTDVSKNSSKYATEVFSVIVFLSKSEMLKLHSEDIKCIQFQPTDNYMEKTGWSNFTEITDVENKWHFYNYKVQ